MDSADVRSRNFILDHIILCRRSCREFSTQVPPKELIMQIITGGMRAPYEALPAVGREDFRMFLVIEGFGEKTKTICGAIERCVQKMMEELDRKAAGDLRPIRSGLAWEMGVGWLTAAQDVDAWMDEFLPAWAYEERGRQGEK
jgi:hypothetical protein